MTDELPSGFILVDLDVFHESTIARIQATIDEVGGGCDMNIFILRAMGHYLEYFEDLKKPKGSNGF